MLDCRITAQIYTIQYVIVLKQISVSFMCPVMLLLTSSAVCFQVDQWVTQGGTDPLPLEEEHCTVVEVTEEDIQNSVKFVPSLSAVVRKTHSHKSQYLRG